MTALRLYPNISSLRSSLPNGSGVEIADDISSVMTDLSKTENSYFRGVSDASWMLYSASQREWLTNPTTKKCFKDFESFVAACATFFKEHCNSGIRNSLAVELDKPITDFEAFSCAQHFGAPTPFLDFTKNPATALFFMASGLDKSSIGYGAIWEVDSSRVEVSDYVKDVPYSLTENRDMLDFSKFKDLSQFWVKGRPISNVRSEAQSGLFLYRKGIEPYEVERSSANKRFPVANDDPEATDLVSTVNNENNQFNQTLLCEDIPVRKVYLFSTECLHEIKGYLARNGISKSSLGLNSDEWGDIAYRNFLRKMVARTWAM